MLKNTLFRRLSTKKSAFSLIELSVVILIISILAMGAISVSTVALTNAKVKNTRQKMDAIYQAFGSYLATHHRLPCPASFKLTKADSGYGVEEGDGSTCSSSDGIYQSNLAANLYYGMVPVATLGLSDDMAQDGFGTRFSYIIHDDYVEQDSDDISGSTVGIGFSSASGTALVKAYNLPSTNQIDDVGFVLISHGANKYGGFNAYSATQNSTGEANSFEIDNVVASITENTAPTADTANYGNNASFSTYVTIAASNADSDVFDDMVLFKRRIDILRDFDLGFLLPCGSGTSGYDSDSGAVNVFSGGGKNATCPSPNDGVIASQKCGPFANSWIATTSCP